MTEMPPRSTRACLLTFVGLTLACGGDPVSVGGNPQTGAPSTFTAQVNGISWTATFFGAVPISCTDGSGVLIGVSAPGSGGLPDFGMTIIIANPTAGLTVDIPDWDVVAFLGDEGAQANTTPGSTGTANVTGYNSSRVSGTLSFMIPTLGATPPDPDVVTVTGAQFDLRLGAVDMSAFACGVMQPLF